MVGDALTILVADDTHGCREVYSLWLADEHEVLTAVDGRDALETITDDVDMVLLDREMPGLDGLGVARELDDLGHDAHVVMVSSRPPDLDLVEYPIDDYRQKPLEEAELGDVLAEFRRRREYESALEQFFALTATVATLEASMPPSELRDSERYARLQWLVEEKRAEVDQALREAAPDWSAAFEACVNGTADRPRA